MKKTSETVVFFGSGPVAAESLRLLAQDFAIEAVVTKPRAAHHTGDVPVLELCDELGLPVITARTKKELDAVFRERKFQSRVGVLIDFGIIVSQAVIDSFPLGIVNSHFSLLPDWRGADPITFSILAGQEQTGVSLMLLVAAMDEGPLLAQAPLKMRDDVTTPELTSQLIEVSHATIQHILPRYLAGEIQPYQQDPTQVPTYSRKLTKADGKLDLLKSAEQLEREVRAYLEWPKSRLRLDTVDVIVTKARAIPGSGIPGEYYTSAGDFGVYTRHGILLIDKLKPAGKREMSSQAFLAGYGVALGLRQRSDQ